MRRKWSLHWETGPSATKDGTPEKRVPAVVPGAVQLDWARAHGYGEHTYADHWKDYMWMEDSFWSYTAVLEFQGLKADERLFFVSMGIDYAFEIRLQGKLIHQQEGMFTPVELDLSACGAVQGDLLEVLLYPAPKREGASIGREQADHCCKPAVSYGWDWHPRLIPLGIWDETYLEVRTDYHIKSSEVTYLLNEQRNLAQVQLHVELPEQLAGTLLWKITDPNHQTVSAQYHSVEGGAFHYTASIANPQLWWPNGQGEPLLYESHVELQSRDGRLQDTSEFRIGFRTVRLVMHPHAWDEPSDFPKGPSTPPITLQVNGRSIFCKGSNWVHPDIFPGRMDDGIYEPLIRRAKEANMNLLRVWGGGIVNKRSFFERCDEMGIMVWQEFPLACNNYPDSPEYLKVLDQESRSIIRRIRSHTSLAIWCGGNELFNAWSGMTEQSLALRLLNRNCYDLDPGRPFLATSPVMGMAHGNYTFRYQDGRELYQVMPKAKATAYTEFGCPGPANAELLRSFLPEEEWFPPRKGTCWETHHGLGAWLADTWLCMGLLEDYWGPIPSLEELVEKGQWVQSEGYKCIFEEARRQKPVCSMALNWCYNEAWPAAANNSLICWPNEPKPSYYAVAASCRPILASARISKFVWNEGDYFDPELWLLNDLPSIVEGGRVEAFLKADNEELFLLSWDFPALQANENLAGPIIRYRLPKLNGDRMTLQLRAAGHEEWNSSYTLIYRASGPKTAAKHHLLNM
jgi:beta-mannosidase